MEYRGYTYLQLGNLAGIRANGFINYIVQGKRKLSDKNIPKIAKALELKLIEKQFFTAMVHMNHARDIEKKEKFYHEMLDIQGKKYKVLEKSISDFLSEWYHAVIYKLIGLGVSCSPEEYARLLSPQIKISQAKKALKNLEALEFIYRDEKGQYRSRYRDINAEYKLDSNINSIVYGIHHQKMMALSAESIERFPGKDRTNWGGYLRMDEKGMKKLEKIFYKMVLAIAKRNRRFPVHKTDRIVYFSAFAFPVTKKFTPVKQEENE